MRRLQLLLPFTVLLFLVACSGTSSEDKAIMKSMEATLLKSNQVINGSTETAIAQLERKTLEPENANIASTWLGIARQAMKISKGMFSYIEDVKRKIQENKNAADSLQTYLRSYKNDILQIDPSVSSEFGSDPFLNTEWDKHYRCLEFLTSIETAIKIMENRIVDFCFLKSGFIHDDFSSVYAPVIIQNSTVFTAGESLEINAGIGSLSKAAMPEISFDGKIFQLDQNGFVEFRTKTPDNPGNYKIPVTIAYFDILTGKKMVYKRSVEYKVVNPCSQ